MIDPGLPNEFTSIESNVAAVRPPTAYGTAVTPVQDAYGSYTQLPMTGTTTVANETWEIDVIVNTVGVSGVARDCMVTIGKDDAGGSSYTDFITDLVCGPASGYATGGVQNGGTQFRFPLRVPAGCTLAAKASVHSATLTAINVAVILRGKPTRPELVKRGAFVTTFGSAGPNPANGTLITPGTSSEGAYTQIGSALATTLWYFTFGYGIDDSTMTNGAVFVDIAIGDATNKRVIITDALVVTTASEAIGKAFFGRTAVGTTGDLLYARAQVSAAAADTNNSVAIYGVGG